MGSSPKWTVPPHVGLTILLWGVINKSLKAKPTSGYRQALTDNDSWAKEEEEEESDAWLSGIRMIKPEDEN